LEIFIKKLTPRVYATLGSHQKSQFFPLIRIYRKKAISTANQGPRSKTMSKKIEVKNLMSVSFKNGNNPLSIPVCKNVSGTVFTEATTSTKVPGSKPEI